MMNQKRGHRCNKLPGDGELWAPNNITENLEQQTRGPGPNQLI